MWARCRRSSHFTGTTRRGQVRRRWGLSEQRVVEPLSCRCLLLSGLWRDPRSSRIGARVWKSCFTKSWTMAGDEGKTGQTGETKAANRKAPDTPAGSSRWGSLRGLLTFGSGEKSTATKATLGDEMSMYYDEKLKRWVDPVRVRQISLQRTCGTHASTNGRTLTFLRLRRTMTRPNKLLLPWHPRRQRQHLRQLPKKKTVSRRLRPRNQRPERAPAQRALADWT